MCSVESSSEMEMFKVLLLFLESFLLRSMTAGSYATDVLQCIKMLTVMML